MHFDKVLLWLRSGLKLRRKRWAADVWIDVHSDAIPFDALLADDWLIASESTNWRSIDIPFDASGTRECPFCGCFTNAHVMACCGRAAQWCEVNKDKMYHAASPPSPIPMIIHCPFCRARHIDVGDFATKSHHTHACQECGAVWRPAIVATVGVHFLPGYKNP